jgi:hypothetical protein
MRILWVECHEFVEQDVGHRGHAHRGTRMAGVGGDSSIDLKEKNARSAAGFTHD